MVVLQLLQNDAKPRWALSQIQRGKEEESKQLLGGGASVDELAVVVNETLDLALALEVADGNTGERAVDLHTVNQGRLRNHLEGGHLLEDTVVGGAVKDNHVLGLQFPNG